MVKLTEALGTKYFCISWETALSACLQSALDAGEEVDISEARFVPSCAEILNRFNLKGLAIVKGTPYMMATLEENRRRAAISAEMYPDVLKLPTNADELTPSILNLPKCAKMRIDSALCLKKAYLAYVAAVCVCRPDVDLFFDNASCAVMEYLHNLLIKAEGHGKWWILKRGVLTSIEVDSSTGMYDMGEFGIMDEQSMRTRFKAVPYEFGTKNMAREWKSQLGYAYTTIINSFKQEERNTLYGLLSEEE